METTVPITNLSWAHSITETVNNILRNAILTCFPQITDVSQYFAYRHDKMDYHFPQIKAIANLLNLNGVDVADKIHNALFHNEMIEFVETVNNEWQFTIVFNISLRHISKILNDLYRLSIETNSLPPPAIDLPKKIVVDFSSPNVAKEMHVGHLRSTIIGESICRMLEYCGANVIRTNHIGDWGTQFGMLIAYLKKQGNTSSDSVDNLKKLMLMYQQARKEFDTNAEFKEVAHLETVKLQNYDPENIQIWKKICQTSIESFNQIYQKLHTHAEVRGESFYQSRMVKLVADLEQELIVEDGMKVMFAPGIDLPFIIVKSDGGFTYDTSDLAALRYRLLEEQAEQVIYVVDSGQKKHFDILFGLAKKLGWAQDGQMVYVGFGLVLGEKGKLKTRSGESVMLRDLLDCAYKNAKKITVDLANKRHPEWNEEMISTVAERISINCIKYADLKNPRLTNYKFSLEK